MIRPAIARVFRLALRRSDLAERDVDDEIDLHIELRTQQLVGEGWPAVEARAEALRRFGALSATRPKLVNAARRREAQMAWSERLDAVRQDARYALRQLRRSPGFAAAAVLTLGLGIGANAVMFGVVDRLLLRPPAHVREAGRVARLYFKRQMRGFGGQIDPRTGYPGFKGIRDGTPSIEAAAAYADRDLVVGRGDLARQTKTLEVTGNYFSLLGTSTVLGRPITPEDDLLPTGSRVVVLGHRYWQNELGGTPGALGQTLTIEGESYRIIGVAPAGFNGIDLDRIDLFIPLSPISAKNFGADWYNERGMTWISMIARMRPGATLERLSGDATVALRASVPDSIRGFDYAARVIAASVMRAQEPMDSRYRAQGRVALSLAAVAGIVLLIACANVANLILVRGVRRRREIAVRVALGVSRGRLLAQLLTESALIALAGGATALVVARIGSAMVRSSLLVDVDWSFSVADGRLLGFTLAATTIAALLSGLAPALALLPGDVVRSLKAGGRDGRARTPLRTSLIVAQAALSVVLLAGAGLFIRSLRHVNALDFGYEPYHLLVADVQFQDGVTRDARLAAFDALVARARQLPGVQRAALSTTTPFWSAAAADIAIPDFGPMRQLGSDFPLFNAVSRDYFETMRQPIVRGRAFGPQDVFGAPRVAIVNETMAKRIWPGADPIGRCIKVGRDTMPCSTVVGVARDIVSRDLRGKRQLFYYLPMEQRQAFFNSMRALAMRTSGDPALMAESVRRELTKSVPGIQFIIVRPLASLFDPLVRPWRLGATMFSLFGALALLIAAVGLYSVMAYSVAQRTHELGVRMALGAGGGDLVRLVMRQGVAVVLVGIVIGGAATLAAGPLVAPLLFDLSPRDPVVFVVVTVTLVVAALVATALPARRATRVDPNAALRAD